MYQMLNFDDISLTYYSSEQLVKIRRVTVGIAGAGGLGSNCAVALVRAGFSNLVIADFDIVEPSNLNRQAYFSDQIGRPKVEVLRENLLRINPGLHITALQIKLDTTSIRSSFDTCDAVVEAFDDPAAKAMITEAIVPGGKMLVAASGLAGFGASDRIQVHKMSDTFYLIGDLTSGVAGPLKPFAPCVALAAAKQADTILEWALTGTVTIHQTGNL
jgi:sulfur carrier protein ThiS adenylyltransferase